MIVELKGDTFSLTLELLGDTGAPLDFVPTTLCLSSANTRAVTTTNLSRAELDAVAVLFSRVVAGSGGEFVSFEDALSFTLERAEKGALRVFVRLRSVGYWELTHCGEVEPGGMMRFSQNITRLIQ